MQNPLPPSDALQIITAPVFRIKSEAESKRSFQANVRSLTALRYIQDRGCENWSANRPLLTCKDLKGSLPGSENQQPCALPNRRPSGPRRTIRKLNPEYFKNKKVQFRTANVRISFEIVDRLI